MARKQRRWTAQEDLILAEEVKGQCIEIGKVRDWSKIAAKIPGRDNKDCRKRFYNQVTGGLKKGLWGREEDERLRSLVNEVGLSWAEVARSMVNRSAEQCSKRWKHHLDPSLDHSRWCDEDNVKLLVGVKYHGTVWSKIQQLHFPGRSTNNIKNAYALLKHRGAEPPDDAPCCCTSEPGTEHSRSNSSSSGSSSSTDTDATLLGESEELNAVDTPDTPFDDIDDEFDLNAVLEFTDDEIALLNHHLEGTQFWSETPTPSPPMLDSSFRHGMFNCGLPDIEAGDHNNTLLGHWETRQGPSMASEGEFVTAGMTEHADLMTNSNDIDAGSATYDSTTGMVYGGGDTMDMDSIGSPRDPIDDTISRTYITIDDVDPSVLTAVMDILVRKRAKVRFEMRQQ